MVSKNAIRVGKRKQEKEAEKSNGWKECGCKGGGRSKNAYRKVAASGTSEARRSS